MVTTCAALAFAGGALAVFEVISHRRTLAKELSTIAAILAENSTAALAFDNSQDAEERAGGAGLAVERGLGLPVRHRRDAVRQLPAPAHRGQLSAAPAGGGRVSGATSYIHYRPVEQAGKALGTLRLVGSLVELQRAGEPVRPGAAGGAHRGRPGRPGAVLGPAAGGLAARSSTWPTPPGRSPNAGTTRCVPPTAPTTRWGWRCTPSTRCSSASRTPTAPSVRPRSAAASRPACSSRSWTIWERGW